MQPVPKACDGIPSVTSAVPLSRASRARQQLGVKFQGFFQ